MLFSSSLDDGSNAIGQINAALTCEDEVNPYVTSADTTEVSTVEVLGTPASNMSSPAIQGMCNPDLLLSIASRDNIIGSL